MYSITVPASTSTINEFKNSLIKNIYSAKAGALSVMYEDSIYRLGLGDIKRIIVETPAQGAAGELKKMLLEMVITNDNVIPGSGLISLLVYLEACTKKYTDAKITAHDSLDIIQSASRSTIEECQHVISQIVGDSFITSLALEASSLAGCDGQIYINKNTCHLDPTIELSQGHRISHSVIENFWIMIKKNKVSISSPGILVIDGIIESVGEIHHILEEYSKNKEPLFIFARGFADDVISTLSTNIVRGTLNVYPVRIPIDEHSINVLNDIAVICLTDVVSSLKGELISSIELDTVVRVDYVILGPRSIMIKNKRALEETTNHKKYLLEKRNSMSENDILFKSFTERAKSMAGTIVEITLDRKMMGSGISIDRLDLAIRILKDVFMHGKVELKDIRVENKQSQLLIKYIADLGFRSMPTRMLISGLACGITENQLITKASLYIINQ